LFCFSKFDISYFWFGFKEERKAGEEGAGVFATT
jgi:hypothetical protein